MMGVKLGARCPMVDTVFAREHEAAVSRLRLTEKRLVNGI
jgi:hypothetical protein